MKNEKLTKITDKIKTVTNKTVNKVNKIKKSKNRTSARQVEGDFCAKNSIENEFIERINIVENEKKKIEKEKKKLQEEYKDLDNKNVDEIKLSDITKSKNKKKVSKKTVTLAEINKVLEFKENEKKKTNDKNFNNTKNNKNADVTECDEKKKNKNKKRKSFTSEFIKAMKKSNDKNKTKRKNKNEDKNEKNIKIKNFGELKDKFAIKDNFKKWFNKDTFMFSMFVIIFLFLFVSMLMPMPNSDDVSTRVKSNLVDTEKLTGIEKIKTEIENAIIVKFPWYEEILDGYFGAMEASNRKLYENANDNELILIDAKNGIYIDKNEDQLIRKYEVEEKDQDIELAHRVKLFNAMSKLLEKKNVNAYIYAVSGIWTSEAILNFELDYKEPLKYVNLFAEKIDDYIKFDYLKIIDYTTFKKYFFATDHHWRIHGAYEAYLDICDLFDVPEEERVKANFFKVEGVEFMGSNAKYCSYDNIVDYLYDIEFDDSRFTVKLNGEEVDNLELSKKEEYLNGDFEKDDEYYNHYAKYFHSDLAEIVYTFNENKKDKKNLLLIGDSYSNCIDKEIASHFYNTYVIDLRYYEDVMGEKFILKDYVEENDITDVLVMLSANSIYFESADLDLGIEGANGVKENRETN